MTSRRSFVLAIDHRASFRRWATEICGEAVPTDVLSRLKVVVGDALVRSLDRVDASEVALLVDDEYGGQAMGAARDAGIRIVVPAEQSGMPEFIFEHGADFAEAIVACRPDVVKALVRYNPSSDSDRNSRSRDRLLELANWCDHNGYPIMLELLVPPGPLDQGDHGELLGDFDSARRPRLTVRAIEELRSAGLSPQWWKLEGQPDAGSFAAVADATGAVAVGADLSTRADPPTSCLVLGRGADETQLSVWIRQAAATPGYSGFAVGRSLWMGPLAEVLLGRLAADEGSELISAAYIDLIATYSATPRAAQ